MVGSIEEVIEKAEKLEKDSKFLMSQEFKIEIISPDKTVFLGNTEEVLLPCYEGQITILKDHIPLITFLRPGVIKIGKNEEFYVEDGTVEFSD